MSDNSEEIVKKFGMCHYNRAFFIISEVLSKFDGSFPSDKIHMTCSYLPSDTADDPIDTFDIAEPTTSVQINRYINTVNWMRTLPQVWTSCNSRRKEVRHVAIPIDDVQWVCARMAGSISGTVTSYCELNYKLSSATFNMQEMVRQLQVQKTDCMVYQLLPPKSIQVETDYDAATSFILWFKKIGMNIRSAYLKDGMTRILQKVESIQDISAMAEQLRPKKPYLTWNTLRT